MLLVFYFIGSGVRLYCDTIWNWLSYFTGAFAIWSRSMQTYDPEIKESDNYVTFPFLSRPEHDWQVRVALHDSPMILVVDNVLSPQECGEFLQFFDESSNIRQGNYNRKKLIINCEALSQLFMQRVEQFLPKSINKGSSGKWENCNESDLADPKKCWRLDTVNPAWRLVKGDPNSKLPRHFDGSFVKSVDYRSIYTVIVYLTDSDGDTRFYYRPSNNTSGTIMDSNRSESKYLDVTPKQGRFVFFHQSIEHEGLVNHNDFKYFMRSEMMYSRQECVEQDSDREAMKKYQQARECFFTDADRSERFEIEAFRLSPTLEDLILGL
jgi:hypothetical protein